MFTPSGRKGTFLLVAILLLISILLEQWIARIFPWLSELGGIRPMIVFLDIPLQFPFVIDWLPVGVIFIVFYAFAVRPRQSHVWPLLGRWWLLLGFMLTGGLVFYVLKEYMSRQVSNGIDSFGFRADVILPYPSGQIVHLQGSMIVLIFVMIGWRLLVNKAVLPPIVTAAPPEVLEEPIPGPHRVVARIPEPVPSRAKPQTEPGGKPCIHVSMPPTVNRSKGIYPCVVDGEIKPAAAAKS
jgi:hypothetical protein